MILTRKRLLVDIFLTRRLLKSLAFCEFASVNFEPWVLLGKEDVRIIHFISVFSPTLHPRLFKSAPVPLAWRLLAFMPEFANQIGGFHLRTG